MAARSLLLEIAMVTIRSLLVGGLLLASLPALAAPLTNAAAVEHALRAAGYTQIHDLERDDGLWEADVSRADGVFAEIYVDPANGEIFDAHDGRPLLDSAAILQRAAAQQSCAQAKPRRELAEDSSLHRHVSPGLWSALVPAREFTPLMIGNRAV